MCGRVPMRGACARLAPLVVAFTLSVLAGRSSSAALPEDLIVERLGEERGFPSETITALYRDRAGFLWVGSREGLAFWDGYAVRVYEHDVGNPDSLPDNSIRTIFEDREGRLWIGTNTKGLARLDRATGRFEDFRHDPADPRSLSHDSVYSIVEDGQGALWVGTQQGLNRFDPATRTFERFVTESSSPGRPAIYVFVQMIDRSGRLWVGSDGGGLFLIDPATRRVTPVPFAKGKGAPTDDVSVNGIAEDQAGTIWCGTDQALYRYDESTASLHIVDLPELDPGGGAPIVTSIVRDTYGVLWLSTWNRGLVAFDPVTRSSRGYRHDAEHEASLSSDRIACLLADDRGEVWVGTWGNGINRFGTSGGLFRAVVERRRGSREGLPYHEVTSVLEDRRGTTWIGTWGKGLWRRERGSSEFVEVRAPSSIRAELAAVLSLVEAADGTVWAGSMAGLTAIEPRSGKMRAFSHDPKDPRSLGPGYVTGLLIDRSGTLWVGVGGSGLHHLEPDGGFKRFVNAAGDSASLSDNFVTTVLEASDGTLWVGTRSGGLNALDPHTGRWTRFLPSAADAGTIGHHHVSSILEGRAGVIWVGTDGGGIAKIVRDGEGRFQVTRVTTSDGLVNQNVASMVADEDGSLWIGTRHGLSRYEPVTGRFHNYGVGDGLPGNEFSPAAASRGPDGLFLGTSKGLVMVRPGTPFVEPLASPTLITEIRTISGPLPLSTSPWDAAEIHVSYRTPISLAFAVLDFRSPHRFSYRLEGQSDAWIDLGSGRQIAFSDLAPGSYKLRVRGRNAVGAWSESPAPLEIQVKPPFWMTWWFRAVVGSCVIAAALAAHTVRLLSLERRNRALVELQEQREKAREQLRGAYDRLRFLARSLEVAKEDERKHIARELHDDLGPSLTAVVINLELLRSAATPESAARIADTVEIVDRMVQQIRELSLDLRPPLLDEMGLVPALKGYMETQAERSGLEIEVHDEVAGDHLPAEVEIVAFRLAQEAVTNVIRHAKARRALVTIAARDGWIEITVEDNGKGFDVRSTIDGPAGKALGLLGMQERVRMLDGEFEIVSEPSRGTKMRARLPIGAAA